VADARDKPGEVVFVARRSREFPGTWIVSGVIDENADLSFLETLSAPTRLNMKDVRRINSYGVRAWIEAIRKVPAGVPLDFVECSSAVIDQTNMVAGFLGRGKVSSFFAPMVCSNCGRECDELFHTDEYQREGRLPDVSCDRCGGALVVDDLEEHYLLFAREA
jgi:hypothetical protein